MTRESEGLGMLCDEAVVDDCASVLDEIAADAATEALIATNSRRLSVCGVMVSLLAALSVPDGDWSAQEECRMPGGRNPARKGCFWATIVVYG